MSRTIFNFSPLRKWIAQFLAVRFSITFQDSFQRGSFIREVYCDAVVKWWMPAPEGESEQLDAWGLFRYWFPFAIGCRAAMLIGYCCLRLARLGYTGAYLHRLHRIEIRWTTGARMLSISSRKSARSQLRWCAHMISKFTCIYDIDVS